ncbi:hypothetical protein ACFL2C_01430 [Patescibacteria group bacterium]
MKRTEEIDNAFKLAVTAFSETTGLRMETFLSEETRTQPILQNYNRDTLDGLVELAERLVEGTETEPYSPKVIAPLVCRLPNPPRKRIKRDLTRGPDGDKFTEQFMTGHGKPWSTRTSERKNKHGKIGRFTVNKPSVGPGRHK